MKRCIRTITKQALCILLILGLGGCWNSRELDALGIVLGLGIDVPPSGPGKVLVISQLVKPGEITSAGNGSGGGGEKAYWNVESEGDTVFQALENMTAKSSRTLFHSHNSVMIFGREAAEAGVKQYLDFFLRNPESRNNVLVAISDTTAGDVLNASPTLEKITVSNVKTLIERYASGTSQTKAVDRQYFADCLTSESKSPVAPLLRVEKEGEEDIVTIVGTAVFKDDRMVGALDGRESRGLMWVLGEVKDGAIIADDGKGGRVSVKIIRAKARIKPVLKDGKMTLELWVFEEGNVCEESGTADLTDLSQVLELEGRISEVIRQEVIDAIAKAREYGSDIFGFGDLIAGRYPKQWKEMKGSWDELFQTLEIELTVDANVRLIGKMGRPLGRQGE